MFGLNRPTSSVNLQERYLAAAAVCDLFVMGVTVAVLVGWMFHIEFLKQVLPGLAYMNPLTAISLGLAGIGVWISRKTPLSRGRRAIIIALCSVVIVFSITRLLAAFTTVDAGLDQILFRKSLHGNRQAPNTSACLLLIAIALIMIDFETRRKIWPGQIFSLWAGALALVAMIGYVYSTQSLYGLPTFIPMALHTAMCCILLCLAIFFSRPESGAMAVISGDDLGGILARRLLVLTITAPVVLGWFRLVAVHHGWISDQLSDALLMIGIAVLFSTLVWGNARLLRKIDSERRRAQAVMRHAEQRYRAVVQQTAEGIYLLDATTKRVVESNAAFARLLGYTSAEATHLTAYDIVDHKREDIDHRVAETLEQGHAVMGERQYKRKDGTKVDVQANASVITCDGQPLLCTVVHDITRRKKAEREIQSKNQQLEEIAESERRALWELKQTQSHLVQTEKLAGLGQMVAGVAHEINNPLSFVSNNVAVLQRDLAAIRKLLAFYQQADALVEAGNKELMEEIRDLGERIDLPYTLSNSDDLMARSREGLRRIQQIVKDLREFARLDESDLHEVDLNEGITSTVNIIRGTAKKHQVEIELDLQPMPLFSCYPAKVNQVIMNMLSNAIDASGENTRVIVRSRLAENGNVELQVEDHGSGISPAAVSRIFDPFYTTKPPGQGTGLGLSISYGIVQDHGGKIEVQSEVGKGTCFTVRLPKHDRKIEIPKPESRMNDPLRIPNDQQIR